MREREGEVTRQETFFSTFLVVFFFGLFHRRLLLRLPGISIAFFSRISLLASSFFSFLHFTRSSSSPATIHSTASPSGSLTSQVYVNEKVSIPRWLLSISSFQVLRKRRKKRKKKSEGLLLSYLMLLVVQPAVCLSVFEGSFSQQSIHFSSSMDCLTSFFIESSQISSELS